MVHPLHRSYLLMICLITSRTSNAYVLSLPQLRAHLSRHTTDNSATKRDMTITRAIRSCEGVVGVTSDVSQCSPLRTRRPHNSYLKILISDSVSRELHSLTQQLKNSWDNMESLNSGSEEREFEALYEVISDEAFQPCIDNLSADPQNNQLQPEKSKPKFKIKTRSLQSLHMTYFFCGTMLDEMPSEQLVLFNSMLHEKLHTINNKDGAYWLKFRSIDLFPPQRQNLIAATFEASPALDELYEDLCDIAMTPKGDKKQDDDQGDKHPFARMQKEYEFPLLRSAVFKQVKKRRQQQQKRNMNTSLSVPHITLANIVGGKNSAIKKMNEWLSEQRFHLDDVDTPISVEGLSLGGPYPRQVDLDWSFQFNVEQK